MEHYGKSVAETLQSIEEHEVALASLQENISQIRLELRRLEQDADNLMETIQTERASITAPIHQLPPELLIRIFLSMLKPQDPEYPPRDRIFSPAERRNLMLVSRQWHSIIQNGPEFWATCLFQEGGRHVEKIESLLSHSGSLPLQIVLSMPPGTPLLTFWNRRIAREEHILSRISHIWIEHPSIRHPNLGGRYYQSLQVLETARNLTRLVLANLGYSSDTTSSERINVLRFPALRSLFLCTSDTPAIEAPALRALYLKRQLRVSASILWNLITKAPYINTIDILEDAAALWSPIVNEQDLVARSNHFQHLEHIRISHEDHILGFIPDISLDSQVFKFQLALLRYCIPSVIRSLSLIAIGTFGRHIDHKYTLEALPRFENLTCLRLEVHYRGLKSGSRFHRVMLGVLSLLEGTPRLEDLTLISNVYHLRQAVSAGAEAKVDLALQALLLPSLTGRLPHGTDSTETLCPRLCSLNLKHGVLHFPTLLHAVIRERTRMAINTHRVSGQDTATAFKLTLRSLYCRSEKPVKSHVRKVRASKHFFIDRLQFSFGIDSTGQNSEGEGENFTGIAKLIDKTGLGPANDVERLKPLFDIGCPRQRLDFLCNLFGYAITSHSNAP